MMRERYSYAYRNEVSAFKEKGKERPPIIFKEGLNVVLGKNDGAMSIGKFSALLAIDFMFGGDTYVKSDGVKQEGNHSILFAFEFNGIRYYFERIPVIVIPSIFVISIIIEQIRVIRKQSLLTG
ncbi:hypothetical protein [Gemella morbillorum]|uniref:hypothetical protein n=1 Tax=Gemella morbillorum TaxID=29391 RepID=UPI00248F2352|nr:hypothetical protein [Gemella morbillorum]